MPGLSYEKSDGRTSGHARALVASLSGVRKGFDLRVHFRHLLGLRANLTCCRYREHQREDPQKGGSRLR
jgi:hypothetical protein